MRILIVHTYYAPDIYGGAEYSVKKLAEQLTGMGHTVRVLCTADSDRQETVDGVDVLRLRTRTFIGQKLPKWKRLTNRLLGIWNIGNERILDRAVREFQPDVIHTNNLYGISPIIWRVAKKNGVRLVHTLRDYHLLCPRVAMACGHTGMQACVRPMLVCRLRRACHRIQSRYADCVTAPSKVTLDALVKAGFFAKADQTVIPNATDFDGAAVRRMLERKTARERPEIRFVYLGTLSEQKGVRWLLDAFRALPDERARLSVAGKGELQDAVEEACRADARIRFEGFLSEAEVTALLSEADVLICPSQWEEPFGRVVLDAYKHAMPAIVSDLGALPTLVKDGATGCVVRSGDVEALTDAMRAYLDQRELIGLQATAAAQELDRYSLKAQADGFLKAYAG